MDHHYNRLKDRLAKCETRDELERTIVDLPFEHPVEAAQLYLGIVVLLLANKQTGMIDRVALSDTELAQNTIEMSVKPFEDIKIPISYEGNLIAKAIRTGEPQSTADWQYLFAPALTAEEARLNQAGGAIAFSSVYPLADVADGGAIIYSYYQYPEKIGPQQQKFMATYSGLVSDRLREFLS